VAAVADDAALQVRAQKARPHRFCMGARSDTRRLWHHRHPTTFAAKALLCA
jgi:hypothetical protein